MTTEVTVRKTNVLVEVSGQPARTIALVRRHILVTVSPVVISETGGGGAVESVAGKTGVVVLVPGDVGLGAVDNTADLDKPVSTATQTALGLKADASAIPDQLSDLADDATHRLTTDVEKAAWNAKQAALGFTPVPNTRTVAGKALSADVTLVKADVGLGNVDNTADSAKPVSTAQQTALDLKADAASVPTALADLTDDATHRTITDAERTAWNAAAAVSITVSALPAIVPNAAVAYWYADMFLTGNNATQMYRYNLAANAWVLTSANAANPVLPAITAAMGAGHVDCWLPGSGDANALNRIILWRSTATGAVYEYDLVTNTFSTVTYYPSTETFTTGTSSGIRQDATGKNSKLIIQKDVTGRFFEFDRKRARVDGKMTQNLYTSGAALVGDKTTILKSPDGIEFLYYVLSTSAVFVRSALVF